MMTLTTMMTKGISMKYLPGLYPEQTNGGYFLDLAQGRRGSHPHLNRDKMLCPLIIPKSWCVISVKYYVSMIPESQCELESESNLSEMSGGTSIQ